MTIKEYIKQTIEMIKTGQTTAEYDRIDRYVYWLIIFTVATIITVISTIKNKKQKNVKLYKIACISIAIIIITILGTLECIREDSTSISKINKIEILKTVVLISLVIHILISIKNLKKYRKYDFFYDYEEHYETNYTPPYEDFKTNYTPPYRHANYTKSNQYENTNYHNQTQESWNDVTSNKGDYGQYQISLELEEIEGYKKILYNLNIPTQTKTTDAEIDIVFINSTGIYVIESKNYSGWIYGNANNNQWVQTFKTKHGVKKYKFYNPILQNAKHIEILKRHLKDYQNINYYSLIIFGNDCILKTEDTENMVITTLDTKATINKIKKNATLSNEQINDIYEKLKKTSCWNTP